MLTALGFSLIVNLLYIAFALVALYVVIRLAVTHGLAADRRHAQSRPSSDNPVSSQLSDRVS